MAENIDVQNRIAGIENCLKGNHALELAALKDAFEKLQLKHKIDIQDKEIQLKDKDIQIGKLENEIKYLKIKYNVEEDGTTSKCQPSKINGIGNGNASPKIEKSKDKKDEEVEPISTSMVSVKQTGELFKSQFNVLVADGIAKFFCNDDLQACYKEWFDEIFKSLNKDSPLIANQFVLVKVKCGDPAKEYKVFSYNNNSYYDQYTELNIFEKGWRHENTAVTILHPNSFNKPMKMKEGGLKYKNFPLRMKIDFHKWRVDAVPKEYIGEDGYFIILCLKK